MVRTIKVKGVGGLQDSQVVCRDDATVLVLKEEIEKVTSVSVADQKIIFLGRILENHMELGAVGVQDGHTVFLVRTNRGPASPGVGAAMPPAARMPSIT